MLALLIVVTVVYAGSIGFRLNSYYEKCLHEKDRQVFAARAHNVTIPTAPVVNTFTASNGKTYTWSVSHGHSLPVRTVEDEQRVIGFGDITTSSGASFSSR